MRQGVSVLYPGGFERTILSFNSSSIDSWTEAENLISPALSKNWRKLVLESKLDVCNDITATVKN